MSATPDDLAELIAAAEECAEDLGAYIGAENIERDTYATEMRRYNRDMAPVRRLRAALQRMKESG